MIDKKQFNLIMSGTIKSEFPGEYIAYAEVKDEAIDDLYAGQSDKYLREYDHNKGEAELGFGLGEAAVAVAAIIPVATLLKLSAEAYLALQKCFSKEDKPPAPSVVESELAISLAPHVGEKRARKIASTVVAQLAESKA